MRGSACCWSQGAYSTISLESCGGFLRCPSCWPCRRPHQWMTPLKRHPKRSRSNKRGRRHSRMLCQHMESGTPMVHGSASAATVCKSSQGLSEKRHIISFIPSFIPGPSIPTRINPLWFVHTSPAAHVQNQGGFIIRSKRITRRSLGEVGSNRQP